MTAFRPEIAPDVAALRPDFTALSIVVRGARNGPSDAGSAALLREAEAVAASGAPAWADAHLQAWREAFRGFGAKAKKTPCSAEALRRRAVRDGLPAINAVVDLYNAVSVRFAVPVGGENLAAYRGSPRLCRAEGSEPFPLARDDPDQVEHPAPGEVIWRDDLGVTCRRWNWRQGPRTRLETGSTEMWFVLERLAPMPLAALDEAGDMLVEGVRALAPGLSVERELLRP